MMRVDAYTHFIPTRFYKEVMSSGEHRDIGKRMMGVPSIYDVKKRLKVVDKFKDYSQILSYPMPPFEMMTKNGRQAEEYAKIVNDGFAELCAKYPDHFPGWVAQAPMSAPDVGVREAKRAMKMGALGVQIYTNVAGKPLDDRKFAPFWRAMNKTKTPVWMHPSRSARFADYVGEPKSKYEMWWALGWSYETAAAMSRLVFSGIMDKNPDLKIITHHFGGIVPMLEGRIGYGWDQMGARTSDEDLTKVKKSLKKKRPLNYFKESFYTDTAVFGGKPATECGLAFYPTEKIVFASDCPFDPEKGTFYIRETLRILDSIDMSNAKRKAIMHGNLEKLVGRKLT
ncbi:MAG TPA: amidohydrolase family protein [Xanthobacteraceae bacterium]|jgi:aminocarboxymuconate-semialdehyde decarboxylase|nr:amidohydrolase family protein [Xanthobacteraceae bacterium]